VREFGFEDPLSGIKWLISSAPTKSQIEVLAGHLTVGETYFFRDKTCFDFLEGQVFPELLTLRRSAGRYLRMWSAGCCTGEEPFSIAVLLSGMMSDPKDWNVRILGTDINPLFLKKASAGIYGGWSFRDTPEWVRERFFTKTGDNRFELLPEIRKWVTFTYHNLVEHGDPSFPDATNAMDLILCRNVLMYLTPSHQKDVIRRLKMCLVEGGWLIVSPSEVSDGLFREFEAVSFQGATFYRNSPKTPAKTLSFRADDTVTLPRHAIIPVPPVEEEIVPPVGTALTTEEREPDNKRPDRYDEALFCYERGLYVEAIEKLRPLLLEGPKVGEAAALLSRIFANQGNLSEAISFCERAISAEKGDPRHYYLRATILQEQGEPEKAAADLRRALYVDQDFVPAHLLLGNLALRQGKREESARHFKNAFELLHRRLPDEIVPGTEGLTAGRLMEIIRSTGFEDVA
jgi:chemotaxis protein methyltransferase CheR